MPYLGASDIIYSDVIDSFISEILKYESWILASWRKRSWSVRFTPYQSDFDINKSLQQGERGKVLKERELFHSVLT